MNAIQLLATLRAAGWPENRDLLIKMVAIGFAESSGNPKAHNPTPPDDSYGLWQINMIGALGPQRRAQYGLSSNSDLYNPLINAEIALDIYRSQGLKAWGPYWKPDNHPRYLDYLPQATTAYDSGDSGNSNNSSGNITDTPADNNSESGNTPEIVATAGAGAALLLIGIVAYIVL